MPITAADLRGGCLRGTVRSRPASAPCGAGGCHCRLCRPSSGGPAVAFASSLPGDCLFERGGESIRSLASSASGQSALASKCAAPLMMRESDGSGHRDFRLATLDQPGRVEPGFPIFHHSPIGWTPAAGDLPRYQRWRAEAETE